MAREETKEGSKVTPRYSLIVSFSLRNLILSVVIAVLLVAFFTNVESRIVFLRLQDRVKAFGDQLAYQLQADLPPGKGLETLAGVTPVRQRILGWIQNEMVRSSIREVHLYDPSGKVVLSTVPTVEGRTFAQAWQTFGSGDGQVFVAMTAAGAPDPVAGGAATVRDSLHGYTQVGPLGPAGSLGRLLVHTVRPSEDLIMANRTARIVVGLAVFLAATLLYLGSFFMVKSGSDRLESFTRLLERTVDERTRDLAHRTRELEAIVRWMGDGLVVTDALERIVRVNPRALELMKVEEQDLMGKSVLELTQLFDLTNLQLTEAINRYYADPKATYHLTLPSPFGHGVMLDLTLSKLRGDDGKITGNVVILKASSSAVHPAGEALPRTDQTPPGTGEASRPPGA
ncbi:MAG: PAS domain-containing protein [Candidatus Riflebacteria bacterium]|nr:PAS domain-containing protein [Candidatus Riflebacteria bacterium]